MRLVVAVWHSAALQRLLTLWRLRFHSVVVPACLVRNASKNPSTATLVCQIVFATQVDRVNASDGAGCRLTLRLFRTHADFGGPSLHMF